MIAPGNHWDFDSLRAAPPPGEALALPRQPAKSHFICLLNKDDEQKYIYNEKTPSKHRSEGDIFREFRPACSASESCCSFSGQHCSCAED
ncbi:MAG: hypothetical protein SPG79_05985, partial [Candidatus Faecousia sp.]|nr:hypothetical protein [Candidatus Faecousia sp.]